MTQDFTMAMFNLGRLERSQANANDWKEYAQQLEAYSTKLEKKCLELRMKVDSRIDMHNEIMDELCDKKPRVLSDPKNKSLRDAYRVKRECIS